MWKPLDLPFVARTLTTITTLPGLHRSPTQGDLSGPYDEWFDSGAVKHITGWDEFHFADGTVAVVSGSLTGSVDIRLPSGTFVRIEASSDAPRFWPLGAV